jgi:hypothetical protein
MDSREARRRWKRAAERAVTKWVEAVLGEAQRLAPVEEGTLRASGEAEVEVKATEVLGTVSFAQVYAAAQHEGINFVHPLGGEAKYLEKALHRHAALGERLLAAELRAEGLV